MNSEREQAYLNLINQLLTCPSGEEAEVLETQPELRDDGLVAAMLEEAENLRRFGQLNNANRLMNCAGILLGMNDNTSVAVTEEAEADRILEQGNQQYAINQVLEALQSWEQALTIYQKIVNRQGEANSLGNLGTAYQALGQFHKAIKYQQDSLVISREIGDRVGVASSLGNLGNAHNSLGQFDSAIEFLEQSLVISREIGDRQVEAIFLGSLGIAYDSLGQFDVDFWQRFLDLAENKYRRQIEIDLNYLIASQNLFQQSISTVRGMVEIEQVELDREQMELYKQQEDREKQRSRQLENIIFFVGTAIGGGQIFSAAYPLIKDTAIQWQPDFSLPLHPFFATIIFSLLFGLLFGLLMLGIALLVRKTFPR